MKYLELKSGDRVIALKPYDGQGFRFSVGDRVEVVRLLQLNGFGLGRHKYELKDIYGNVSSNWDAPDDWFRLHVEVLTDDELKRSEGFKSHEELRKFLGI